MSRPSDLNPADLTDDVFDADLEEVTLPDELRESVMRGTLLRVEVGAYD